MSDHLNPYISGPRINQPENFYNRRSILQELQRRDSRAYYLKGNRRVGKSSLLKRLHVLVNRRREKEIAVFLNLDGCADEKDCCNYFIHSLEDAADAIDTTLFRDLQPGTDFVALLATTVRTAKRAGLHVYLLIDEAETLLKLPERTLAKLHPHLVNLYDNLKVVLTATSQLYRIDHATQEGTPFLENFTVRHIGNFRPEDSRALIRQEQLPVEERPAVDPEIAMEVIRLCGGHPMLTQNMCRNLFDDNDGKLKSPTKTDVLLDSIVAGYLETDFNNLETEERDTLRHFNFQTAKAADDIPRECRNHIKELLNLGFLNNENDRYRLANCFLSQWLEQYQDKAEEAILVAAEPSASSPKNIFLSYSKADRAWRDKLKTQLAVYENNGRANVWEDSQIRPGQKWLDEIKRAANATDIFLFLISADLLATDFVMDTELPIALAKHQAGTARVIPVIMRPCGWTDTDFAHFQALPEKGTPVSTYDKEDVALWEVVEKIKDEL